MVLWPLGQSVRRKSMPPGWIAMPLASRAALGPVHVFRRDPRVRLPLEREVEHDGLAHHRLERQLLDIGHVAEEMVRRIDMRARVHRHLDHVRDETLVFPLHDRA